MTQEVTCSLHICPLRPPATPVGDFTYFPPAGCRQRRSGDTKHACFLQTPSRKSEAVFPCEKLR